MTYKVIIKKLDLLDIEASSEEDAIERTLKALRQQYPRDVFEVCVATEANVEEIKQDENV